MDVNAIVLKLPQELCDLVIEYLSIDSTHIRGRKALASASLVCRSWLPRASKYLFKHIEVDVLRLLSFISTAKTSQRMGSYVEELVINGTFDFPLHVPDLFKTLPSLRSIELWSNCLPRDKITPLAQTLSVHHIQHLKLSYVDGKSLASLVQPFEHIGTLQLRSIDDEEAQLGVSLVPGVDFPRRIDRLILDDCCTAGVMDLVQILFRPTAVFFNGFDRPDLLTVAKFLSRSGELIEHLNLLPVQDDDDDDDDDGARTWCETLVFQSLNGAHCGMS
jgi:hypothetical protein